MAKEIITICDLTHTSTGSYATNLMPYPIASIKSNFLHFSKHKNKFEIEIEHIKSVNSVKFAAPHLSRSCVIYNVY